MARPTDQAPPAPALETPAGVEVLGPLRAGDEALLTPAALAFVAELERRFGARRRELLARRVERGDLGRKSGRGFYDYSTDPPAPTED